jgi:tetratricopeptide (TPR) repeat protein
VDADLLVTILTTLGQAEAREGSVAEASRHWLRTVELARRAAEKNPGEAARWQPLQSYQVVIRALMYAGDLDAAERTAREGIRVREALAAAEPANANLRRNLMNAYLELAYVYFHPAFLSFGDARLSAAFHEKALQIARQLAASDPSNATAQTDLALAEAEACAAWNGSDPARGTAYCRDALAIADRWPALLTTEAMSASLADGLRRLGRYSEALESLRSAVATCERLLQRSPWRFNIRQKLVRAYNQMGVLLLESGDTAGAIEYHRRALALSEELMAAIPSNLLSKRDLADTFEALGEYYERQNLREARVWYQKSLDVWTGWPGIAASSRMDVARRRQAEEAVARCGAGRDHGR